MSYKVYFHISIEILTTDIIVMAKELLLFFSNKVLLQDYIWKC